VSLDIAGYGSWGITPRGREVLRGKAKVELRSEALVERPDKQRRRPAPAATASGALSAADTALLEALKKLRRELATAKNLPAYVVFPDKTLLDMVLMKPQTRDQMASVHGVGTAKLEQYGDAFLAAVAKHLSGAAAGG
jgi:ATP-dependent DNA helicase RecQ